MIPAFIFPMIEEKHAMKDTSRLLAPGFWIVFAVIVLMVTGNGGPALADDGPFPWIYGGYKDIGEVHLRYWTADREALESVENLRDGRVDGEICDIWYRKSPRLSGWTGTSRKTGLCATSSREKNGKKRNPAGRSGS